MFTKPYARSVAVVAGMVLAGSVLVAPGVVAAPTMGRVAAWGPNSDGQLGNETYADSGVPVSVDVSGVLAGKRITAIDAGGSHTCAVADGKAYCWGNNEYGQLGNGSTNHSWVPIAVDTSGVLAGKTITSISGSGGHTCAVADGKAFCWGNNEYGQLGNNSRSTSPLPVSVDMSGVLAGKTITSISAGGSHTCVLAGGKAYCWGRNSSLQLGKETGADSSVPVPTPVDTSGVLGGKTITAMDAGGSHTCVLAEGRAYCWGFNHFGELGRGTIRDESLPIAVDTSGVLSGKTVTAISASSHTCAVADGKAYCWSHNELGQVGNKRNDYIPPKAPVAVNTEGALEGKTVTAITAGSALSCAVADGRAYCWGSNRSGQLGNGSASTLSNVPVPVNTAGVLAGKTVTAISAGGHAAVLFASGPQPPTGVVGVAGDAKVSLAWTAPGDDGGSPVLNYVATAIPGGASCTTSGTSCVVSGLANGTAYTFTVTASNAIGGSAPSAPSTPVTPAASLPPAPVVPPPTPAPVIPAPPMPVVTPAPPQVKPVGPLVKAPGRVSGVRAVLKHGTVKITWNPGPATSSYRVRITKPGGVKYKAWKSTTKRAFEAKVRTGKKYRFQVAAVGAGGRGPTLTIRFRGA